MLIVLCLLRLVDDNLQSTLGVLRASSSLYFIQHQQQQQEITAGHTDCQLINQINHPKQSYLATRAASRLLTGVQYSQTAASMGRFRQTLRRLCSRFVDVQACLHEGPRVHLKCRCYHLPRPYIDQSHLRVDCH